MTTINLLTHEEAVSAIDFYAPLLRSAIARSDGRWTWEQCYEDIVMGNLLVFLVMENDRLSGVLTARVMQSAARRWLLVEDLAGDGVERWLAQADKAVTEVAHALDCSQLVMEGRRGWQRVLKPFGWRSTRIVATKEIAP